MTESGRIAALERKVEHLEKELTDIRVSVGKIEENVKTMSKNVDSMQADQKWIFRVVVAGFAGAGITFIVQGGLVNFGG